MKKVWGIFFLYVSLITGMENSNNNDDNRPIRSKHWSPGGGVIDSVGLMVQESEVNRKKFKQMQKRIDALHEGFVKILEASEINLENINFEGDQIEAAHARLVSLEESRNFMECDVTRLQDQMARVVKLLAGYDEENSRRDSDLDDLFIHYETLLRRHQELEGSYKNLEIGYSILEQTCGRNEKINSENITHLAAQREKDLKSIGDALVRLKKIKNVKQFSDRLELVEKQIKNKKTDGFMRFLEMMQAGVVTLLLKLAVDMLWA